MQDFPIPAALPSPKALAPHQGPDRSEGHVLERFFVISLQHVSLARFDHN